MRIIAGKYKGFKFAPFLSKEIRPTTDRSKEAIFSYLEHKVDLSQTQVVDLFSGSGTISVEFLSRECPYLVSVDKGKESVSYLKKIKKQLDLKREWQIEQNDVLLYLKQNELTGKQIIFADPPYHMASLHQFVQTVLDKMDENALFLLEHKPEIQFNSEYYLERKTYGKSCFSIFIKKLS